MREFAALPASLVSRYTTLIQRIAKKDARVQVKKLRASVGAEQFQTAELWEAKASREYRLFFDRTQYPRTLLGFMRRNDRRVFRRER